MFLRHLVIFTFAAGLGIPALSQTAPATNQSAPVTRVLAIGHIVSGTTRERLNPIMQQEVRDTVRLYLAGKIDQWFVRRDQNGVVFLLNVSSVAEAQTLLEKLPLGQAKLMEFDLLPLGPLSPLALLLPETPGK
jgi:hypothetical protein